jgi:hypothetical protein
VVSAFILNIEAISKHLANRLKHDGPLAALAVCKLKEPTIEFPNDPSNKTTLIETTKWHISTITPMTNRNGGPRTPRKSTIG